MSTRGYSIGLDFGTNSVRAWWFRLTMGRLSGWAGGFATRGL